MTDRPPSLTADGVLCAAILRRFMWWRQVRRDDVPEDLLLEVEGLPGKPWAWFRNPRGGIEVIRDISAERVAIESWTRYGDGEPLTVPNGYWRFDLDDFERALDAVSDEAQAEVDAGRARWAEDDGSPAS